MSKFATISPTHIPGKGKKEYAWENFRDGGYIAIGSVVCQDLSGKSIEEIRRIVEIEETRAENENPSYKRPPGIVGAYERFFSLNVGDCVAVNNNKYELFGVGIITDGNYYFKKRGHDTGSSNHDDFYNHFKKVNWKVTAKMRKEDILISGEKVWNFRGIINVVPEVPAYIKRILEISC